ncbi:MAG: DUF3788 domain-containing protein [Kiritimatiellaeota bacterium]|nr:DUF3788 domain-containing protein [Kiritimatiellota bacterium]
MTELEKIGAAFMRFMRGKYALDEVGNGKDEVKFRRSGKTVVTASIKEDCLVFMLVFGKAEREKFEARRDEFPQKIRDIYDAAKTFHDGKWMWFGVSDLETLEAVKQLIRIKKKPNRKLFPVEKAVHSKCGMRCDLCIHYSGNTDDALRLKMMRSVSRVYGGKEFDETEFATMDRCPGCGQQAAGKPHPCMKGGSCEALKCAAKKGLASCRDCGEFETCRPAMEHPAKIEGRSLSADDVTWGLLPYAHKQYGN